MDDKFSRDMKNTITVQTIVHASIHHVWECWNQPKHIVCWAFASDDWEASSAKNDVRVGGRFSITMAAKDRSASFDFCGTYSNLQEHKLIEYVMDGDDGRHVIIEFRETPDGVEIRESFEMENENSEEKQRAGWQAILENFRKYTEKKDF